MADLLKMDPARIARLRDPARLAEVDPEKALALAAPLDEGPIVDVGAGVGFVSLPFARRFAPRRVLACDIQAGMLELLAADAAAAGLDNLATGLMPGPATLPLGDAEAAYLIMLQVHHELDDAPALLRECRRVLRPGAPIVIVDWKAEDPPGRGRRVPEAAIVRDLTDSGFRDVAGRALYPKHSAVVGYAP